MNKPHDTKFESLESIPARLYQRGKCLANGGVQLHQCCLLLQWGRLLFAFPCCLYLLGIDAKTHVHVDCGYDADCVRVESGFLLVGFVGMDCPYDDTWVGISEVR